jgi:ketosteroid isomerase-like protein
LRVGAFQPFLIVSGTADLERLQELNRGFIRSVRTSDVAWFDRNLSEDFLNSNADGTLVDRAAFLRQIAPACPLSNFDAEDVRIRILGDTALVHGRTTYVKPDGQAGAGRYTDVWVRQGGRWVCVSGDVTRG